MNKNYYKKLIMKMYKNIQSMKAAMIMSPNLYEKAFYQNLISTEMYKANVLRDYVINMKEVEFAEKAINDTSEERQKIFTLEELSKYDGKKDNPAYIAVNGKLYDVTYEAAWAGGTHMGLTVGNDLTEDFNTCHTLKKLEKLTQVGILEK